MNYANISKIHQRSLWHRNQMLNQINPPPPLPLPRPPLQSLSAVLFLGLQGFMSLPYKKDIHASRKSPRV